MKILRALVFYLLNKMKHKDSMISFFGFLMLLSTAFLKKKKKTFKKCTQVKSELVTLYIKIGVHFYFLFQKGFNKGKFVLFY